MVQLDGAATKDDARVIFIGATNRPQVSAMLNYCLILIEQHEH